MSILIHKDTKVITQAITGKTGQFHTRMSWNYANGNKFFGSVLCPGTLHYEVVDQVTTLGLGQSSAVGIGGDPVNGLKHIDVMKMFNDDPGTEAVIMIGEIGGTDEEIAARWVKDNMKKPV